MLGVLEVQPCNIALMATDDAFVLAKVQRLQPVPMRWEMISV